MLTMARNIQQAGASMKAGKWDRKAFAGTEVYGKTLGLVGLGRIGREVAARMQGFGMQVVAYDPVIHADHFEQCRVTRVSLDELWQSADYISVHVPLIKPTENLLNAETLAKCKKGVYILNVARGGIINEADLLQSINSGHVGGAALDVFLEEPPKNRELVEHPKVVVTPHLGASTKEAQTRVAREVAEQLLAIHRGQPAMGIINAPSLVAGSSGQSTSWFKLARQLAVVVNALCDPKLVKKLQVEIPEDAGNCKKGLSAHVAIGLLRSTVNGLNAVNSEMTAKAVGIEIQLLEAGTDTRGLTVKAFGEKGEALLTLSGTRSEAASFLLSIDGQEFYTPVPLKNTLVFSPEHAQYPKDSPDILFYNSNGHWQVFGYKGTDVPALPAVSVDFNAVI